MVESQNEDFKNFFNENGIEKSFMFHKLHNKMGYWKEKLDLLNRGKYYLLCYEQSLNKSYYKTYALSNIERKQSKYFSYPCMLIQVFFP